MPWDALPERLQSPEAWKGTDNDTWYARWTLQFQGWFAFGPRAKEWWANWKFPPRVLFKIGGKGTWRYEWISDPTVPGINYPTVVQQWKVLSRCQYYKRWHFAVQWPFMVTFHIYWHEKDVPSATGSWVNEFDISRLLFIYGPIHWDADLVYWILSFYFGGQWK